MPLHKRMHIYTHIVYGNVGADFYYLPENTSIFMEV